MSASKKQRLLPPEGLGVFVTGRPAASFEQSLKRVLELPVAVPLASTAAEEESQASASSLLSLPSSLQRLNTPFPTPQSGKHARSSPAQPTPPPPPPPPPPMAVFAPARGAHGHKTTVAVWVQGTLSETVLKIWKNNPDMKSQFEFVRFNTTPFNRALSSVALLVLDDDMVTEAKRASILSTTGWERLPTSSELQFVSRSWTERVIHEKKWVEPDKYTHKLQQEPQELTVAVAASHTHMPAPTPTPAHAPTPTHAPAPRRATAGAGGGYLPNASKFACQSVPENVPPNLNEDVSSVFEQLTEAYTSKAKNGKIDDNFRHKTYITAAKVIKALPVKLTESNYIELLKKKYGLGKKTLKKVGEILQTGACQKLRYIQENPMQNTLNELCKVWGIGPTTAHQLYNDYSVRSIADLRVKDAKFDFLTARQKIGLRHFDDLQHRIPRTEVERIFSSVAEAAQKIDKSAQGYLCGSYRRGKNDSGDVDVLIEFGSYNHVGVAGDAVRTLNRNNEEGGESAGSLSHSEDQSIHSREQERIERFLQMLLQRLKESGVLTDHLAGHLGDKESFSRGRGVVWDATVTKASYMGIGVDVTLPATGEGRRLHRRIDIKVYPPCQLPFALLYFTGNDIFNRSMRLYAKKIRVPAAPKGYTLNDKGLFPKLGVDHKGETVNGPIVPGLRSERAIMEFLGLQWREPHDRTGNAEKATAGVGAPVGVGEGVVEEEDKEDDAYESVDSDAVSDEEKVEAPAGGAAGKEGVRVRDTP